MVKPKGEAWAQICRKNAPAFFCTQERLSPKWCGATPVLLARGMTTVGKPPPAHHVSALAHYEECGLGTDDSFELADELLRRRVRRAGGAMSQSLVSVSNTSGVS